MFKKNKQTKKTSALSNEDYTERESTFLTMKLAITKMDYYEPSLVLYTLPH